MAPIAMSNDCSSRRCIDLSSLPGTSSVRLSSRNDNLNGSESLLPVRCEKHLVARHHEFRRVHALASGMAGCVEPGPHVYADGIDDQGIAFPMSNRISHPSWVRILRQRTPVHVNLARRVENLRQHHDLPGRLNDLKRLSQ